MVDVFMQEELPHELSVKNSKLLREPEDFSMDIEDEST